MPLTRWEEFFRQDERVLTAPTSHCVKDAVDKFSECGAQLILDVACGVGRDSFYLGESGFQVIGVDAAGSGLTIATRRKRENQHAPVFVQADARHLPFRHSSIEGTYCFGLLHEFTGDTRKKDISGVMTEIHRVLKRSGMLILAVLAGQPDAGLPHVYLFNEQEFDIATHGFRCVIKRKYHDIGCTGREDYVVWCGTFIK